MISFHGTGLSVAPPINFHEIAAACEDPEEVGYIRIYNAHQSIFSSNYIYVLFFYDGGTCSHYASSVHFSF